MSLRIRVGNPTVSRVAGRLKAFERKQGIADFAQPADPKESGRRSNAQFDLDLKDSMPGWKDFD